VGSKGDVFSNQDYGCKAIRATYGDMKTWIVSQGHCELTLRTHQLGDNTSPNVRKEVLHHRFHILGTYGQVVPKGMEDFVQTKKHGLLREEQALRVLVVQGENLRVTTHRSFSSILGI